MVSGPDLSQSRLSPKTTEYEFFGPVGALFISIGCPLFVLATIFLCNENGYPRDVSTWKSLLASSLNELVDWKAIKWYLSFQIALVLLWLVLPGKWARGRVLRDGSYLEYKCNGMTRLDRDWEAFMSLVCIVLYTWSSVRIHGIQSLTFLYDHSLGLAFAALLESVILATATHISSFRQDKTPLLADGGNTGNHIYDVQSVSRKLTVVVYWKSPKSSNSRATAWTPKKVFWY